MDFSLFQDKRVPPEASVWLRSGEQSTVSGRIKSIAGEITGRNRRERLYRSVILTAERYPWDPWYNKDAFSTTADEIMGRARIGGCSDSALVMTTLFRASGIPSRMVVTANVDWMHRFKHDRMSLTTGHCFIEVFLEDRWFLFDPTFRWLYSEYSEYDPDRTDYPHGEVLCSKGRDFWDMGIRSIHDFDALLRARALSYDGEYDAPHYPRWPF